MNVSQPKMRRLPPVYCIPTANPELALKNLVVWIAKGYSISLLVDGLTDVWKDVHRKLAMQIVGADQTVRITHLAALRLSSYPGYFVSVNLLTKAAMIQNGVRQLTAVTGGDDMLPDPNLSAFEAEDVYLSHFPELKGIMQPIGDDMDGTDRICGSPWIGREWALRAYNGHGAFWPGYRAFYADEELLHVSRKLGLLVQEKSITQRHEHWSRSDSDNHGKKMPYHEKNQAWWDSDKAVFESRRDAEWPESTFATRDIN